MIARTLKITLILLLISSPAWATINGEAIANVLTDTEGNGDGVYLLFNFAFSFLMKYMFAPVALFKCVLLVLESAGHHD